MLILGVFEKNKNFFHNDHKNRPFDRNVAIKRVIAKKRFFHSDHKKTFFNVHKNDFFKVISKKSFYGQKINDFLK